MNIHKQMPTENRVKAVGYVYRVQTTFRLTGSVWKRLKALAERHYDGKCKRAGEVGGYLYGWGNALLFANSTGKAPLPEQADYPDEWETEITCEIGDLDTTAKICEAERYDFPNDYWDLYTEFTTLMRAANAEYVRLNPR